MSADIQRTRIRFKVDAITGRSALAPLTDTLTGNQVAFWQAEDVQVEVAAFSNGTIAADISNFTSITLEIKSPDNLSGAALFSLAALASGSVSPQVDLDQSVSLAHWNDFSEQHAKFILLNSDTNIELVGQQSRDLAVFVWATTSDTPARRIPLCAGLAKLFDSGYGDIGSITVTPPGARMKSGKLQVRNLSDSKYYDLVLRTQDGAVTESIEGAGDT